MSKIRFSLYHDFVLSVLQCFLSKSFSALSSLYVVCNINTLRPRQNGRHLPDNIFKYIFFNENVWISLKISLTFVPKVPINNILALVLIMAWRRPGNKPLSEPMMVSLPRHICVTRPQWVNSGIVRCHNVLHIELHYNNINWKLLDVRTIWHIISISIRCYLISYWVGAEYDSKWHLIKISSKSGMFCFEILLNFRRAMSKTYSRALLQQNRTDWDRKS